MEREAEEYRERVTHWDVSRYVHYSQEHDVLCQERVVKLSESEVTKRGASSLQYRHCSLSQ